MAGDKKTRRARGTGTIFRSGDRWVGRVPVGRNPDGSTRYVERSGATQRAVIDALKLAGPPAPGTTVAQWCERWLASLDVRPSSRVSYGQSVEFRIAPSLGHLPARELTPHQIEAAARHWGRTPGGVHPNTVRLTLAHLGACLGAAVRAGLLDRNPVTSARRPRSVKKEIDPFTRAELLAVIAAATSRSGTRIIACLAATGCRLGEALALDAGDWDAATQEFAVTKTTGRTSDVIGPPKSRHSTRTVGVPPGAVAAFVPRGRGPLFPTAAGDRPAAQTVRVAFARLLKRLGLRPRNLHQLRHSVATHLIADGVPIGDVAKYLGDTPDTVVKTYLHPTGYDVRAALARILAV